MAAQLLALAVGLAAAELAFPTSVLHLHGPLDGAPIEAVFPIANPDTQPITVTAVTADCPCVTVLDGAQIVAAGATAVIRVCFDGTGRSGRQQARLTVTTADAWTGQLLLQVDLPAVPQLSPAFVHWRQGEEPSWRSVQCRLPDGIAWQPGDLVGEGSEAWEWAWEAGEGAIRQLRIRPRDTGTARFDRLAIAFEAEGARRPVALFARIIGDAAP